MHDALDRRARLVADRIGQLLGRRPRSRRRSGTNCRAIGSCAGSARSISASISGVMRDRHRFAQPRPAADRARRRPSRSSASRDAQGLHRGVRIAGNAASNQFGKPPSSGQKRTKSEAGRIGMAVGAASHVRRAEALHAVADRAGRAGAGAVPGRADRRSAPTPASATGRCTIRRRPGSASPTTRTCSPTGDSSRSCCPTPSASWSLSVACSLVLGPRARAAAQPAVPRAAAGADHPPAAADGGAGHRRHHDPLDVQRSVRHRERRARGARASKASPG